MILPGTGRVREAPEGATSTMLRMVPLPLRGRSK